MFAHCFAEVTELGASRFDFQRGNTSTAYRLSSFGCLRSLNPLIVDMNGVFYIYNSEACDSLSKANSYEPVINWLSHFLL